MKIGINPLTWSNDDLPSLGEKNSLDKCLTEAKIAGYSGVELGHKFPRDAAQLKDILAKHQLRLISGWYSCNLLQNTTEQEISHITAHAKLLKALDCKVVIIAETTNSNHGNLKSALSKRPTLDKENWQLFTKRLDQLAEHLLQMGLQVAYHHHMGTVVQSQTDIEQLMHQTKNVGLLVDTGHLLFAKANITQLINDYASRIVHVHCKDIRKQVLDYCQLHDLSFLDSILKGIFTVPGDGCINYKNVINLLKEINYNDWLVIEADQDPAKAHPLTYAKMGFEHIKTAIFSDDRIMA